MASQRPHPETQEPVEGPAKERAEKPAGELSWEQVEVAFESKSS